MDLADVHRELVHEIRYGLGYLVDVPRIATLGDIFDTLILQFEGLGICHLFEFADEGRFRENLARAGMARRYYLRRSRSEQNVDDRFLALSRTRGVLDALAAGSLPIARDIAALSTDAWNGSWEYEDDFCFYRFIHLVVQAPDPFPSPEVLEILARFERSLEGGDSPHLDVAKALVTRDAAAFREALVALLDAEQEKIDQDRNSPAVLEHDVLYWPKSRVSIDGLALLKIAELLRVPVAGDLPLCPRPARLAFTGGPFRDLLEEIERL